MKKLIFIKVILILLLLISLKLFAQDTTYYQKRNELYMTTRVTDVDLYNKHYSFVVKKRQKRDRRITIISTILFTAISTWFWSGYKH